MKHQCEWELYWLGTVVLHACKRKKMELQVGVFFFINLLSSFCYLNNGLSHFIFIFILFIYFSIDFMI